MTVINTTNSVRETGNGSKTVFDYSFKMFETDEFAVFKIDTSVTPEVSTLQVLGVDYTATILTATEGGAITYIVAPLVTEDSFISRLMDLDQPTDIPREANFPEESIENEFDRSRMIDIQQQADIDLKIGFADTSTTTGVTFPEPTANKAILWNAAGDDLINSTDDFNDIVTLAAASAAAAAASASAAATSASNAATSETNAGTSETNAAASAAAALASQTAAATSAANALTSETNAATSETNAATSAANAATSETNAGNSATAAAASAAAAATSETNAGNSETNAATSETNAATSETNAATSETNAAASAAAAAASAAAAQSTEDVNQTTHGFSLGQWVYNNGTIYALADASAEATANVIGVVTTVTDVDNFTITFDGKVTGLSGLTKGATHYLSETSGQITVTAPVTLGAVVKPVLVADSTTSGFIFNQLGVVNAAAGALNIFRLAFDDGDLAAGLLAVTHNLGEKVVLVQVYDETNKLALPDDILHVTANTLQIDLISYGTIAGTWNLIAIG